MIGEIEKFDNLGRGILYDNGLITFVPKTVPGDVIEYEILKKAKKYNIGKLKRVIIPSKSRITPKCPYFDNCGGCDLQHISYKDTIKYKKDNINYLLKKHNYSVNPIVIENDKCLNYRNKISLKIIDGKIGYYESDTNKIVPINNCLLAKESINNIISNLDVFNIKNGLITIRCNELDEILLIITTEDQVNLDNISSNIIGIIINDKLCYGIDTIRETINSIVYQISYNSFFQVNSLVASKMFNIIKENIYGDNILDLYCGVGAITLQVASNAKNVTGVEIVSNAINNASYNAKLNGINNAKFILQDSSKAINDLKEYYDTIIVDPPRVGLSKTVCNYLINSNSKRIIYVSCNPQTLFRDLNILKEKYAINSFYLFDMFSYTEHCESVCILEKINMKEINQELKKHIEKNIFPKYDKFYAHGMMHINAVIENMMMLAEYYDLNKDMAYVVACYHDSGLSIDRDNHEKESGKILYNDMELKKYFTNEEIKIMKEAIEDHRGSRKIRPRNFYGECISDSDRDFDISILARRQINTTLKCYPNIKTFDAHFERCYEYICGRINASGVFNLWTNNPTLIKRRDEFQKKYLDKDYARKIYKEEWDKAKKDGTMEKILNYYEDY